MVAFGELGDAGGLRRIDDRSVLGNALTDLGAGDQHDGVEAFDGGRDRGGVGVVEVHDTHAQIGGLFRVASSGDDRLRVGAALEEAGDDEAAEVAGRTGDEDGHEGPFVSDILDNPRAGIPHSNQRVPTLK